MPYQEYQISSSGECIPSGRIGIKRKRTSQEAVEEIAWTASRCQRLLRTISSRINALRRIARTDGSTLKAPHGVAHNTRKTVQPASSRRIEHWSTVDPVWLPDGNVKTKARTYTSKSNVNKTVIHDGRRGRKPEVLAFPSPFIRRIGSNSFPAESPFPKVPMREALVQTRRSRQLPVKSSSDAQEAERGLEAALTTLLAHTKPTTAPGCTGARSLLHSCLRRVPAYIEFEAEAEAENGKKTSDNLAVEVFSYLEDFGTRDSGGWEGLRDVARSQAVHNICSAILDAVLSTEITKRMIRVCTSRGAVSEGQDILRALLLGSRNDIPRYLEILEDFSEVHGCDEFKFRTFHDLARRDVTNLARTCESPGHWSHLLRSLARPAGHEALEYFSECIASINGLELPDQSKEKQILAIRSTLLRLTVMACAGLLLHGSPSDSRKLFEAVQSIAANTIVSGLRARKEGKTSLSVFPLLCSQFLFALDNSTNSRYYSLTPANLSATLGKDYEPGGVPLKDWKQDFVSELAENIVALENHLKVGFVERLLDETLEVGTSTSSGSTLLKSIALEVIMAYTQAVDNVNESTFADYLHRITLTSADTAGPRTPHRQVSHKRFRWEQGLCEWVSVTPFAAQSKRDSQQVQRAETMQLVQAEKMRSSPHTVMECSPDILALSLPRKRRKIQGESPTRPTSKRMKSAIGYANSYRRRKSSWLSGKDTEASDDELGL